MEIRSRRRGGRACSSTSAACYNEAPRAACPATRLVVIEEEPHERLKRDGMHLHHEAYISVVDAPGRQHRGALVKGRAKVKVEPGTQSGRVMRLKGRDCPTC